MWKDFNKGLVRISLSCSHLVDLLLVQVKDLSRGSGSNLLVRPVARLRAVPTVPSQHKYHLGTRGAGGQEELRGLLLFSVCFTHSFFSGLQSDANAHCHASRRGWDWRNFEETLLCSAESQGFVLRCRSFTAGNCIPFCYSVWWMQRNSKVCEQWLPPTSIIMGKKTKWNPCLHVFCTALIHCSCIKGRTSVILWEEWM